MSTTKNKSGKYLHLKRQRSTPMRVKNFASVNLYEQLDTDRLRTLSSKWYEIWEVNQATTVDVKVNRRLRRSLGICRPTNALIGLNNILLQPGNDELLEETLCHELAHLITHQRYGRRARPHGNEWATLMLSAGFRARVQIPSHEVSGYVPSTQSAPAARQRRYEYEHYCPACDATMTARRTNYRWRCAPCLSAGRSGELTVTRRQI